MFIALVTVRWFQTLIDSPNFNSDCFIIFMPANESPVRACDKTNAPSEVRWWVYMVQTRKGDVYTGITTDVQRRFRQHTGELAGGAKFFRLNPAVAVVYQEITSSRSEASKREAQIKRWSRKKKLALCEAHSQSN